MNDQNITDSGILLSEIRLITSAGMQLPEIYLPADQILTAPPLVGSLYELSRFHDAGSTATLDDFMQYSTFSDNLVEEIAGPNHMIDTSSDIWKVVEEKKAGAKNPNSAGRKILRGAKIGLSSVAILAGTAFSVFAGNPGNDITDGSFHLSSSHNTFYSGIMLPDNRTPSTGLYDDFKFRPFMFAEGAFAANKPKGELEKGYFIGRLAGYFDFTQNKIRYGWMSDCDVRPSAKVGHLNYEWDNTIFFGFKPVQVYASIVNAEDHFVTKHLTFGLATSALSEPLHMKNMIRVGYSPFSGKHFEKELNAMLFAEKDLFWKLSAQAFGDMYMNMGHEKGKINYKAGLHLNIEMFKFGDIGVNAFMGAHKYDSDPMYFLLGVALKNPLEKK